jgi:glycosyltransferase involved in cell wall biosynthesis
LPREPFHRPTLLMTSSAKVSAIVPARDEEATIAAAVESLAGQPEIGEIIVANDQSSDATPAQLTRLARRFPHLRILETQSLPGGWVGKNYAAWLGAAQAGGEWLLFTDADGVHLRGSTARALADAAATGAGLVSYSPEQETPTWWERAMIPFVFTRLGQKFSYDAVNDPASPAAAANGQYLLIRREVYDKIGGHAAVAGEVLEDVALARIAKQAGVRLHFASGHGILRVRMYRTFRMMWQGWTKNLYPLVGGNSRAVGRELRNVVPWIPIGLLLLTPVHVVFGVLGAVLLAGRHAAYAAALLRNRFPASRISYYMPAVALYVAALLASEWLYAHGHVAWKGREYPVHSPDR